MALLGVIGKFLISVGLGVLLFVAWTLWGTGLVTQRQQERLAREFGSQPVMNLPPGSERGYDPPPGAPVFRLRIPTIDLDAIVVEGVQPPQLALGPGHYPSCRTGFAKPLCTRADEVWPGEQGRVIVSGHRTTHGAPFWDLDKLTKGDKVHIGTRWGEFTYAVSGRRIVDPNARDIADPLATRRSEIAFTTCNPRFSASQRLVVFAKMVSL